MKSLAVCDLKYAAVAARVATSPLSCPPLYVDEFRARWLEADFVYLDLHGRVEEPGWLFAGGFPVVSVRDLADLPPKVVFATTCYLPLTQFYDPLRRGTLICGDGENYGSRSTRAMGAPLLGLWFRRFLERGLNADAALKLAKARVALTSFRSADRDALRFFIAPPLRGPQEETQ